MPTAGTFASGPTVPFLPVPTTAGPGGGTPRIVVGVLLAVLGAATTAASWVLLVASDRGRLLDHTLMIATEERFSGLRAELRRVLEIVGVDSVGLALVALAGIALVRRRPAAALSAVVLVLGTQVVTQGLKLLLPREGTTANSLPSGHVTVVTALVVATLIVLPAAVRPLAAVPGVALVVGASFAVVAAGWHRPGDVLAAYAVVTAVGGLLLAVDGIRRGRGDPVAPRVPAHAAR